MTSHLLGRAVETSIIDVLPELTGNDRVMLSDLMGD